MIYFGQNAIKKFTLPIPEKLPFFSPFQFVFYKIIVA